MNLTKATILTFITTAMFCSVVKAQKKKINTSAASTSVALTPEEVNKRVEDLIAQMTLEEKVGEMTQIALDRLGKGPDHFSSYEPFELNESELKKAIQQYHIGSVLNTSNNTARTKDFWNKTVGQIQNVATKDTRLKVPVIYGIDAIHGVTYTLGSTLYPQQIAQAASRNRELVRKSAEISAYETRASSIPWNFSPVLDLGVDPRFSRQWEGFGEDPYVASEMGVQVIKGYQGEGNNIADKYHVSACMKHFLGYSAPNSGKDRTPAFIPEEVLREYHVPSFKAAIDAGAKTIMINSGLINNIPTHSNYNILTKLLKEELGFKGFVVTDWQDIENLYNRDHIATNHKEAIRMAINAGIDMSMVPYNYEVYCDNLIELVKEGKVKQERIDDAVRRILKVKVELGLFEQPVTVASDYPKFGSKEFANVAYQMATEVMTLLKNQNNVLPLAKTAKVLVTGPNANSMRTLNGGWSYSWQGEKATQMAIGYNTILKAVQNEVGTANVTFVPGVSYKMDGFYYEEFTDKMDEAVVAAKQADAIILCLGENSYAEKPGDLQDLYISELQTQLALKLAATGKPVILVLNEGRPRVISRFEQQMKAIVQTYLPGNYGGDALADVLFGDVNPSGKLPYTYPRYPNSVIPYFHKLSEEQKKAEGAYNYEADFNPQFEFGAGLSYTTFEYKNLGLSTENLNKNEQLSVSVDVTNTGVREGKEVVQLFTSDLYASLTPDAKRLRKFEKINLKPGETQTVKFIITADDLSFYKDGNIKIAEAGEFDVKIDKLSKRFTLTESEIVNK